MRQAPLLRLEESDLTPYDIIKASLQLLLHPDRWAQHAFLARTALGRETTALHRDARSWTLIGALRRSADDLGLPTERGWDPVLQAAYDVVEAGIPPGHYNLLTYNNTPWVTHEDVVRLLTSTLDRLESKHRVYELSRLRHPDATPTQVVSAALPQRTLPAASPRAA